jgi:hypothetical protein
MVRKDMVTMKRVELKRLYIIQKTINKSIKQKEASELLKICERQVRRVIKRVQEEGEEGIIHGLRGRRAQNATDERLKARILKLCETKYTGFGPTLLSEKLFENEKIRKSDETLRKWMLASGLWQPKRKKRKHRQWRERKSYQGEMVQMDGSHHDWLEGRGPKLVLMGYIDDADSKAYGRFYEYEGTLPAMDSFKRYVRKNGLPQAVYVDNHMTYKSSKKVTIEEELENIDPMSQFERALKELDVNVIHARSAPAKGRVERLFKTLQDRLVKELRLENAKTLKEANQCLNRFFPKFNKRFSVKPSKKESLYRPIPKGLDLDEILCKQTKHVLRNDFTVAHDKKLYQVLDRTNTRDVEVQERVNGQMLIIDKGQRLKYKEINTRPHKVIAKKVERRKRYIPPADASWRRFKIDARPVKRKEWTFI